MSPAERRFLHRLEVDERLVEVGDGANLPVRAPATDRAAPGRRRSWSRCRRRTSSRRLRGVVRPARGRRVWYRRASGWSAPDAQDPAPGSRSGARGSSAVSATGRTAGASAPGSLRRCSFRADTTSCTPRVHTGNGFSRCRRAPTRTALSDDGALSRDRRAWKHLLELDAPDGRRAVGQLRVDVGQGLVLVVPDVDVVALEVVFRGSDIEAVVDGALHGRIDVDRLRLKRRGLARFDDHRPEVRCGGIEDESPKGVLRPLDQSPRRRSPIPRCARLPTAPRRCRWAPSCRSARASRCRRAPASRGRATAARHSGWRSGTPAPSTRSSRCASSPKSSPAIEDPTSYDPSG